MKYNFTGRGFLCRVGLLDTIVVDFFEDNFFLSFLIATFGEGGGTQGTIGSSSLPTSSLLLEVSPSSLKKKD